MLADEVEALGFADVDISKHSHRVCFCFFIIIFGWCGWFVHLFIIIVNGAVVFYSQSSAMWW